MDRKKKVYIQYTAIFILIMVFAVINFSIKTSDVWRKRPQDYKYETIKPKDLMNKITQKKDLIIIDTRIKEDFIKGHIKGAVNLPYTNFKIMTKALTPEIKKEIFIYSDDEDRSKTICEFLNALGFSKIRNLDGGINGWVNSEGELVK